MSGRVTDESGAVLPGVTVTATHTDTGATRTVVTDANGAYALPNLPTGPYRLEAMLQGFRTYVQTGIVLQVAARTGDQCRAGARECRGNGDGGRSRAARGCEERRHWRP